MRLKADDTLICIGDFQCRGAERGVPGDKRPWTYFAGLYVPTLVLLEGNHDHNNKVRTIGRYLFGKMSHFNFVATHWPTDNEEHDPLLIDYIRRSCAFAIVGHVHNAWQVSVRDGIVNINVGVDANNYRPVLDDEVVQLYLKNRPK